MISNFLTVYQSQIQTDRLSVCGPTSLFLTHLFCTSDCNRVCSQRKETELNENSLPHTK